MDAKKKPALALVISAGKGKEHDEDDEDSGEYSAVVGELAELLGVEEDKREEFETAFHAAVAACK